jgi:hypothetical protein
MIPVAHGIVQFILPYHAADNFFLRYSKYSIQCTLQSRAMDSLTVLDSVPKEETGHMALVLWRAWTVRNKVTRAGETLSIDDSVCYVTKLGNSLNELKGGIRTSACSSTDTASNSERRPQER